MIRNLSKNPELLYRELEAKDHELETLAKKLAHLEAVKNQMAKFVPRVARTIIERGHDQEMEKETGDVSVLMLDIVGCTALCENLSYADMNYLIERYFSGFLDEVHRNKGDVNETTGDGLMAIFRGKNQVENALNAIRSAIGIQRATRRLNHDLQGMFEPIKINVGISSGMAAVGVTRFKGETGERWTYTASGPITNLASRLCSAAKEGDILIDEETSRRIQETFNVVGLGEMEFRNIDSAVKVFKLIES
ncbi:MAG: adenylate/guanylate cyclase domain-containing protein [Deltaproteobacteria bacterium]|nr:adenylate/guanylate cyclase domain-containing protein [Deltaproteobacteria bacterium]